MKRLVALIRKKYWFQRKDKNNRKREAYYDGNIGIQGNGTFKYSNNTIHPLTGNNCGGVRSALWMTIYLWQRSG